MRMPSFFCDVIVDTTMPLRSGRLADKRDNNRGFNYLSLQSSIPAYEKQAAYNIGRHAWESNKVFIATIFSDLSVDANVISSQVIFKRKNCGLVKARIVPWGHHYLANLELRADTLCLNLEVFWLIFFHCHWKLSGYSSNGHYSSVSTSSQFRAQCILQTLQGEIESHHIMASHCCSIRFGGLR